jgi:ABC-type Na+ efflux pump permease subunit
MRLGGAFMSLRPELLWLMIPVIVGVATSGSLAVDRRQRYIPLILARGISRRQYLTIKALAMAVGAMLAIITTALLFFTVAALYFPFGNIVYFDLSGNPITPSSGPGPVPELFAVNPCFNDLFAIGILALAGAALSMIGVVVGAIVANEYITSAIPFAAVLGGVFVLREPLEILQPHRYLNLWNTYPQMLPAEWLMYAGPLYWLVVGLTLFVVGLVIFLIQEPE